MGNGQSTRVQRRMWSCTPFRYHRISPSNSLNQPLLDDDSQSMVSNLQLEADQEKKAALEKENRDLRSALSRLESKLQSKERATEAPEGRIANLEREVNELKSQVSKLKSERQVDKVHKFKQGGANNYAALEEIRVKKPSTGSVSEMKKASASSHDSHVCLQLDKAQQALPDDIVACLIVLIFLVSILIGINL
ncbi:uncharacterized protein LOC133869741 [Alnus glutinosa]|uniref:uncharacterized protein LOC133869741 n=1 Tax=Alnus glutinosa TaxID=3517 RepID=UPI002D77C0AE|nr:uncharacterized protein LOC133869741 [Alnus glutinosa]